jgi:hypothetical protein
MMLPFVKLKPDESAHVALCFSDQRLKHFALGREPETVVNKLAVFWDEAGRATPFTLRRYTRGR